MQLKLTLQNLLFSTLMLEPKIAEIMNVALYGDIRQEAFEFIEEKTKPVSSIRQSFERNILEGGLNHFIRDIEQRGANASIYKEFYSYFTDEEFRRLIDP